MGKKQQKRKRQNFPLCGSQLIHLLLVLVACFQYLTPGISCSADLEPDPGCVCSNGSTAVGTGGRAGSGGSAGAEVECRCEGVDLGSIPPGNVSRITVTGAQSFRSLNSAQLYPHRDTLAEIILSDLPEFTTIENGTFKGLEKLHTIYIHDAPSLVHLAPDAFKAYLPKLKLIKLHHSALAEAPILSSLRLAPNQLLHTLDLENNKIRSLSPGWVEGLRVDYLALSYNQIEKLGPRSFEGATIARLTLKGNHGLHSLHPDAFVGIEFLQQLDLSETAITQLPTHGLRAIETLRLENVFSLTVIPSIYHFQGLREASLTYPYHCCAFHSPEAHDPYEFGKYQEFLARIQEKCDQGDRERRQAQVAAANSTVAPYVFDPETEDTGGPVTLAPVPEEADEFGFHESLSHPPPPVTKLCGNITVKKLPVVVCTPLPDAYSPCEDIMGTAWLRVSVWIVVALALVGNTSVLLVLILAPGRMSVQRFLMANLSLADLSMGLYLLMVASEDLVSLGTYFNYAIRWQQGWGCQLAGFLTVFASELSVFTLAVITGERWYALTRAMHLTRRLTIVGAAEFMAAGWALSIILAALPLVGVSSYSKTSICLPMDGTTGAAQGYLVFLLLFNGLAFTLVAFAYWHMYRAVAHHGNARERESSAQTASDAAVAKKMALLVFTDFACWAPVAFFGLTAVAGVPLIGVTDSKILLVFFYPLNACCNPYLYAILTKQYRRDLLLLLARFGLCPKRAARFKTGLTSVHSGHTMHTMLHAHSRTGTGGGTSVSCALAEPVPIAATHGAAGGARGVNGQSHEYMRLPTMDEDKV